MAEPPKVIVLPQDTNTAPSVEKSGITIPGEYYLEKVDLICAATLVSVKFLMVELSYFEDIHKGFITGNIVINNATGFLEEQTLNGSEFLHLVFKKTKDTKTEINKTFRVYKVGNRTIRNYNDEVYTLHFCSEELVRSEQIKISKAYPNKKVSEVVTDIITQISPNTQKNIEETYGLYSFVVPNKSPFESINWVSNYARPAYDPQGGADFIFYENLFGFNFRSLQSLFKSDVYGTYNYVPKNLGTLNRVSETVRSLNSFYSYEILDSYDALFATSMGMYANKLISIDPVTRRHYNTEFDYGKYFKSFRSLNEYPLLNPLSTKINNEQKTQNQFYDSLVQVAATNSNQENALYIKDRPGSVAKDIFIETYAPYRAAQMAMINYTRIKAYLPGDPNMTVGRVIEFNVPSFASRVRNKDGNDKIYSGNYLVTAVRHIINIEMKYETVIEMVKESLPNPYIPIQSSISQNLDKLLNKK